MTSGATPGDPPAVIDTTDRAWRELHRSAAAPYRRSGRFAWHWARSKLGRDPAFRRLLEIGALPADARVLDIGCGMALLASLLQACSDLGARGAWPTGWPVRSSARSYTGIELLAADLARARTALAASLLELHLRHADMRNAPLPACDLAVMLDVLHYVDHAAQAALLVRVRDALRSGVCERRRADMSDRRPGRLLLRVADERHAGRFRLTQWIDRFVFALRSHRPATTWGRPLADWSDLLRGLGFRIEALPMSRGTPFANVLLVCDWVEGD